MPTAGAWPRACDLPGVDWRRVSATPPQATPTAPGQDFREARGDLALRLLAAPLPRGLLGIPLAAALEMVSVFTARRSDWNYLQQPAALDAEL